MELWRSIMVAVGAQAGRPADLGEGMLSQVFQVLAQTHDLSLRCRRVCFGPCSGREAQSMLST